jgi:hypothetical protein
VHCSLYVAVAVSAPLDVDPETARLPLHAPEPVHAVALVLVQVRVLDPPEAIDEGEAVSETVGAATPRTWPSPPPGPTVRYSRGADSLAP